MMWFRSRYSVVVVAAVTGLLLAASTSRAELFTGTLYYTNFTGGGDNVNKVTFSYNDQTHSLSLGAHVGVAAVNGADGILFGPTGNLIVTSNTTGSVYNINPTNGNVLQTVSTSNGFPDFHMALDPSGTKLYSSDRYDLSTGPLDTFAVAPNGNLSNATGRPITGGDTDVTQLAFAPNGKILYTDGTPNANGSIGLFTFGSPDDTTTQLIPANTVRAAHGVVYDPFTGLWTMFGGGAVATMDPNAGSNALITASLKQRNGINADFDQGSVDGFGHALIAGNGELTFIDYSQTHDITNPNNVVIITGGFGNIDDVAPLVGPGANTSTPEPSSLTLLGLGAAGLFLGWKRRRTKS